MHVYEDPQDFIMGNFICSDWKQPPEEFLSQVSDQIRPFGLIVEQIISDDDNIIWRIRRLS